MFVATTIQPSILRTATAFSEVLASPLLVVFFVVGGEDVPLSSAGDFESISISFDIAANLALRELETCKLKKRTEVE